MAEPNGLQLLIDQQLKTHELSGILKPILVGLSGGTASGKTTICEKIATRFKSKCCVISLDSFYKSLSKEDHDNAANYDFDHPDAIDFKGAQEALQKLLNGQDAVIPVYDFTTHSRVGTQLKKSTPIIIFEGLYGIYLDSFRQLMGLKIFVLTPADVRLSRRILRDTAERGRTVIGVLEQYNRFVKPAYDSYVRPQMKHADVIIPFTQDNVIAIEMLVQNLQIKLDISAKIASPAVIGRMKKTFSQTEYALMTPQQIAHITTIKEKTDSSEERSSISSAPKGDKAQLTQKEDEGGEAVATRSNLVVGLAILCFFIF